MWCVPDEAIHLDGHIPDVAVEIDQARQDGAGADREDVRCDCFHVMWAKLNGVAGDQVELATELV